MKKKPIIAIFIFSIILLSCTENKKQDDLTNDDVIPVTIQELGKVSLNDYVNATGRFTSDDETILSFKTGGVIKNIYANKGDFIKKGQILATLEMDEIQSQVNQAQTAYEKAKRDYNRVVNLFKDSVATRTQFNDSKTALEIAEQQLNIAKFNLNYSEIRAIEDGYILEKFVNQGQIVGQGTPILLVNGKNNNKWILRISLSDIDWTKMNINDRAEVSIDGVDGTIDGFVKNKSKGTDIYTGTLSADIELNTPNKNIANGMFGKVRIYPKQEFEVFSIPLESLIDCDASIAYVFTTNDLKTAEKRKIEVGNIINDKILVKSGLENSKYLILTGNAYLKDKSSIKIVR